MATQAKRCTKCNGYMEIRLGSWECQNCGHTEPASERKTKRRSRAIRSSTQTETPGQSSAADWKKEHGTHLLDFSKGSGRGPEPRSKAPPPHQPEYQTTQEFTKREQKKTKYFLEPGSSDAEDRAAEQKLTVEKLIFFGLWLLLSAYVAYLVVTVIYFQEPFSFDLGLHEIIYIAIFSVTMMIGIMWYTLYSESPELKWTFVILGCLTALGQTVFSFLVFTNDIFMDNLTFNSGFTGIIGLFAAAALTVGWTCWYVYILYRDIKRMQS